MKLFEVFKFHCYLLFLYYFFLVGVLVRPCGLGPDVVTICLDLLTAILVGSILGPGAGVSLVSTGPFSARSIHSSTMATDWQKIKLENDENLA